MLRMIPFTGLKIATVIGALSLFSVETIAEQPDMLKYAVTQGGLFGIVCVLLWVLRRDSQDREARKDDKIGVMTDLVRDATQAQTKTADALATQAQALAQMSITYNNLNMRHSDRP